MHLQLCQFPRLRKKILIALYFLLLAGCVAKSDRYDVPLVPLPESYLNAPDVADDENLNSDITLKPSAPLALSEVLEEWWRILSSPELDILMDRTLANNPDMRIATLRIAQTQARSVVASSGKLPEISVPVRVATEAPEGDIGSVPSGGKVRSRTTYQASLRADWRPDIWGEYAALSESAEFQLWRATFQRDEVQRNLVASVVVNYLEYLSLNDRLRVARETEKVLSEMLGALATRLEKGDATVTEEEQQKAAVYAVRATIPVLEQQREVVANRLASLAGTIPGSLNLSDNGLDSVIFPTVLPGVPSSYLLHRPDVRVVEARLLATDADIDVARARVLPPLDLTAQLGYGSWHLAQLLQPQSLFWNAIANLSATIFDNGKRSGEMDFAKAVQEEMVETYIRVIYDALREVEDSLRAIKLMDNRMEDQQIATDSSRQAWDFSQDSYVAGAVDYLVVLDTERTYHRNLDEWYNTRLERYRGLANLFSALGGGVSRGGAIPGDGERPLPLTSKIDSTLTAAFDYGVILSDGDLKQETKNNALQDHNDFLAADVDVTAKKLGTPASIQNGKGLQSIMEQATKLVWTEKHFQEEEEYWLVEMAGVYERNSGDAAWRDMCTRFPKQMENLSFIRSRKGLVDGENEERASWYRMFISKFSDFDTAEELCATLRNEQLRCQVVSSQKLITNQ